MLRRPARAAFSLRLSAADAPADARSRSDASDVAGRREPADRLQLDRLRHAAWSGASRAITRRGPRWRASGSASCAGCGRCCSPAAASAFLGLAFVLTSIHHWLINPERNLTLALIPIGFVSILLGIALLIVTAAIYILGRNRIRTSAEGFSSAPGGG